MGRAHPKETIVTSLPLHPAIVHLPLGLAFVMPLLAIGFAWALWKGRIQPRAWATLVALQAVLLGAGLVAMNTGEREEDRVAAVVPQPALEQHEVLAEQFVWAAGGTLLIAALGLVFRRPAAGRTLMTATVLGTVFVAASAVRVGHAGGQLVYKHNAGAAYSVRGQRSAAPAADVAGPERQRVHDER
ncbi:MAG: hypothetical protein ACXW31_15245 [Thermoanaerobaculia bacterium]